MYWSILRHEEKRIIVPRYHLHSKRHSTNHRNAQIIQRWDCSRNQTKRCDMERVRLILSQSSTESPESFGFERVPTEWSTVGFVLCPAESWWVVSA